MRLFVLLTFSLLLFCSEAHPIHISVTEIQFNRESKKIECSVKLFADDLEKVIGDSTLGLKNRFDSTDHKILNYLDTALILESKGKKLNRTFIGKELDKQVIWLYFEFDFKNKHSLHLYNALLVEEFPDQDNIVHFVDQANKESFLLNKAKIQVKFDYQ